MQLENAEQNDEVATDSTYRCTQCQHGWMLPAHPEGEPEYTDLFMCSHCQHTDNITTPHILWSQTTTSILGILVCTYLLADHWQLFFNSLTQNSSAASWKESGLMLLGIAFLAGFLYVLVRALRAYRHRRLYLR